MFVIIRFSSACCSYLSALCLVFWVAIAFAQPIDNAIFNGITGFEVPNRPATQQFCLSYLPISQQSPISLGFSPNWMSLPNQRYDSATAHFGESTRGFTKGTTAIFTPSTSPTRFWFVSNGHHTWDSTMRRVTRAALAPRAAMQYSGGQPDADINGSYTFGENFILPVRDTPGVFRHMVLGFSEDVNTTRIWTAVSYNQMYSYRVDARFDDAWPQPIDSAGNGAHLRYFPDPAGGDDAVNSAVVWRGGDGVTAYDTTFGADRGSFPTISRMVAIAHGNGRDWWIVAVGGQSCATSVGIFLVDNQGVHLKAVHQQAVPFHTARNHYYHGGFNLTSNRSGTQIAMHAISAQQYFATHYREFPYDAHAGIALWDFDRCSGTLSPPIHLDINYSLTGVWNDPIHGVALQPGNGVMFSQTSKFLYYSELTYLSRFDLSLVDAASILSSEELVFQPDDIRVKGYGFQDPYEGLGGLASLHLSPGPNPIMLSPSGGSYRLIPAFSNLEAESVAEVAGNLESFEMPCLNGNRLFSPYYQLYDQANAPCDTLGIDGVTEGWGPDDAVSAHVPHQEHVRLYPSPVGRGTLITVEFEPHQEPLTLTVYSAADGRVIGKVQQLLPGATTAFISTKGLAAGLYIAELATNSQTFQARFVVVSN